MSVIIKQDAFITDEVLQMVVRERAIVLPARECKHRLAGYGYSIRDTDDGKYVLETLPLRVILCELSAALFH